MLPPYYQIVKAPQDTAQAEALAEAGGYPLPFASLLAARGYASPEAADWQNWKLK